MSNDLNQLYQQLILNHSKTPRNFRVLPEANRSGEGNNPACGDRFKVFLKLNGDLIEDISFQGSGCAISKASASMMTDAVKGKTASDAKMLFEKFQQIVKGDATTIGSNDLAVFAALQKFPMRMKCALLPWQALHVALHNASTGR